MRHSTYTLRIETRDDTPHLSAVWGMDLISALSHAEDVVNDALPEGFYCKIDGPTGEGVDLGAVARLEAFAQGRPVSDGD
jgi:hypothetical protein